jgi:hypothetical protein
MLAPLPSTDRISMDESMSRVGSVTSYHRVSKWYQSWFSSVQYYLAALGNSGLTAARPTTKLYIGYPYFDTTLGKPIWCKTVNPVVWVDATGAVV